MYLCCVKVTFFRLILFALLESQRAITLVEQILSKATTNKFPTMKIIQKLALLLLGVACEAKVQVVRQFLSEDQVSAFLATIDKEHQKNPLETVDRIMTSTPLDAGLHQSIRKALLHEDTSATTTIVSDEKEEIQVALSTLYKSHPHTDLYGAEVSKKHWFHTILLSLSSTRLVSLLLRVTSKEPL